MRIFTVASDVSKMSALYESLEINGHPRTQVEVIEIKKWRGFIDKIEAMKNCIDSLPDNEIVCFIDAYDVLCFSDLAEIEKKFKEYNSSIVFSSELNCYPVENLSKYEEIEYKLFEENYENEKEWKYSDLRPIETTYKYVNSGGYIGFVGALKQMFQWKPMAEIEKMIELGGDQQFFTQYYLEHAMDSSKVVCIDDHQRIFQSLYKVDLADFAFFRGRFYNHILRTQPCFVHFNGFRDYGWTLRNMETQVDENAMQVFIKKMRKSIENGNAGMEWRIVPFYYGGVSQGCIPQKIIRESHEFIR